MLYGIMDGEAVAREDFEESTSSIFLSHLRLYKPRSKIFHRNCHLLNIEVKTVAILLPPTISILRCPGQSNSVITALLFVTFLVILAYDDFHSPSKLRTR